VLFDFVFRRPEEGLCRLALCGAGAGGEAGDPAGGRVDAVDCGPVVRVGGDGVVGGISPPFQVGSDGDAPARVDQVVAGEVF
jgi:hypothetical protein